MSIIKLSFISIIIIFIYQNLHSFPGRVTSISLSRYADFRNSWKYYYKKGLIQFRGEIYDYSIENMEKALERKPDLYIAANILADIYVVKNKRRKAIEYYKKSLEINNTQADIHCKIGELYDFFIIRESAFYHLKEAIRIDPTHARSHLNLGRCYIKINDRINGNRHFALSYKLKKNKSEKIFNSAIMEENNGNYKKAIDLYKQTIMVNPAAIEAYLRLYEIFRRKNRYDTAAAILEKLKFIKPDFEKAYIYLGRIYFNRRFPGKRKYFIEKAIRNLEKAIKLNSRNYETYYTLSRIYDYIGNDTKAKELEIKAHKLEKEIRQDKNFGE